VNIEFYKEYIRNHGHRYSGWYRRIKFGERPVLFFGFSPRRFAAIGIHCNEAGLHGRDCVPMVILDGDIRPGENCIPVTELSSTQMEAIERAMLQGDAGEGDN